MKWTKGDPLAEAQAEARRQKQRADDLQEELSVTRESLNDVRELLEEARFTLDVISGDKSVVTGPGNVTYVGRARMRLVVDE